jgi:1-acyl-sn-glycerol-3-phosphate acyltransferase
MKQPTPQEMDLLGRKEQLGYRIADFVNRNLKEPLIWWNRSFMFLLIWLCLGRRLNVYGLEKIEELDEDSRVIIAANHRSFFDFFVATWINYTYTPMSKRIFFPVRSTFFYDSLIGIVLNFFMGAYSMFPPILRQPEKKAFNKYSISRVVAELEHRGCIVGFHPEGTRNKTDDPYSFLTARPGIGEVILRCPQAKVIPIFITGPTNSFFKDLWRNWITDKDHPLHVYYGAPIDYSDMMGMEHTRENFLKASQACMAEIKNLSETHKKRIGEGRPAKRIGNGSPDQPG